MKNKKLLYSIGIFLVLILVILIFFVKTNKIVIFDKKIFELFVGNRSQFMKYFSIFISSLASAPVLIAMTALLCIDLKNKKLCYYAIFNLLFSVIVNQLLKNIICRERPFDLMLISENGYSFPSGHSMVSFAFYGYIIYLIYKDALSTGHKKIHTILLSILILLIGYSRIYLGVHYASDVLGGYVVSLLYLTVFIFVSEKILTGEIELKNITSEIFYKNKKFLNSFKFAYNGIVKAFKSERNMKIHFIAMFSVIVMGFIFEISLFEWLICLICFSLVISFEIINTAIETVVDLVSPSKNEKAGIAKDLAAGAVLFNAIMSAIAGLIVFLPKMIEMIL